MLRDAGWIQTPLFAPAITWKAPELATLPSWKDAKRVSIDIETRDQDLHILGPGVRRGGYICGVSFAIEDGPAHYLPTRHEGGGNLDEAGVLHYLRDQASHFTGTIIGARLPYDLDYLWSAGIEFKQAKRHADVQVCEGLLDELQIKYGLDAICGRRGLPGKDEGELRRHATEWGVDAKRDLWRLPAGAVGRYAEADADRPLRLYRVQEQDIADQKLERPWDDECKVMLAILRMTRRGVGVDVAELESVQRWARTQVVEALAKIKHATGVQIESPANSRQIERALAEIGIKVPHTPRVFNPKTGKWQGDAPSVTKEWLDELVDDLEETDAARHPVILALKDARDFYKLDNTYATGMQKFVINGRVHPTYKQLRTGADDESDRNKKKAQAGEGARYARMASRTPNGQNQPNRHKIIGPRWRRIFVPKKGKKWGCFDYSQQEPRTTVHYAEICVPGGLPGAREFADQYRNDPTTDSHSMFAALTGLPRKDAKEVYLAITYGQGGAATSRKLGLPTKMRQRRDGSEYLGAGDEAQSILDRFHARAPFLRQLSYKVQDRLKQVGYITLLDGRRVRFPRDAHGNIEWMHKALNRLVQGSAAIQTKRALVLLDAAGYEPELAVHDEFDFSLDPARLVEEATEIRNIMRDALPLRVPSKVDVEVGDNYAELSELPLAA